jgi:hypothetical protein
MDILVFENPLLKIKSFLFYVISKSKKILELHFLKLACWGYVE